MISFFTHQLDYIYFLYGFSFLMLAAMCYILWKAQSRGIPWFWLGLFGFTHGINEWLDLANLGVFESHALRIVMTVFMISSFLFLTQFGCHNFFILSKKKIEKWIYAFGLIIVVFAGVCFGENGISIFARYYFGLGGGLFAAVIFFLVSKQGNAFNKKWLIRASIFLGIYALTHSIVGPANFFPAAFLNTKTFFSAFGFPVQFVRSILAIMITLMIWFYWYSTFIREYRFRQYTLRGYAYLFFFLIVSVVFSGWVLTSQNGEAEINENKKDLLNMSIVTTSLFHYQNILLLDGASSDIGKPAFEDLRRQLKAVHDTNKDFRFVCLEGFRDEKVFFFADAEPPDSKDYSPPGQTYDEVPKEVAEIFINGKPTFIGPFSDRWGRWVSAFAPVKDPVTKRVLAVLEIDMDASESEHRVAHSRFMGILVTTILSLLILSIFTNLYLKEESAIKVATSEERFRIIFENAPEAVFILDLGTKEILETNFLMTHWLGFSRDQLLKMAWHDLFEGDLPENQLKDNVTFTQESFLKRKPGLSVELTGIGLKFRGRDAVLIFMRDITDRKRMQDELKAKEEYFRSLIEDSLDVITIINPLGVIKYLSPSCFNVLGFKVEELTGKNAFDFIHPDDKSQIVNTLSQITINHDREGVSEYRMRHKDGSWRIIESRGRNYLDDPRIKGIIVNSRDVSERKRAEDSLRKLSQAVEQSPAAVVITDPAGNIEYVNNKFSRVTGYTISEVIGKNPKVLKSGETSQEEYQRLWKTITAGDEWRGIFHNKKKDGTLFWEMAAISPIRDEKGRITHFLAVKEDITKRKEMEDELDSAHLDLIKREKAARQMLTELEKAHQELKNTQSQLLHSEKLAAVGRLSAGIAHEIKNPLAVILLSAERLEGPRGNLDNHNREFVKMIKNAGEKANKVITQLLDFSRQSEMKIGKVDLHSTIDEVVTLTHNMIQVKLIELKKEYSRKPIVLQADKTMIEQVLINLITNAIDAIQEKGIIQIKTYLEEETKARQKRQAVIEISDNGCGMSDEVKARIFEPFYTTKEQGKGTGLGLSIVYGILEKHGGQILVDSQVGVGTKFTITFPYNEKTLES